MQNTNIMHNIKTASIFTIIRLAIWFLLFCAWFSLYLLIIKSIKSITQDQMTPYFPTAFNWEIVSQNFFLAWESIKLYIFNTFVITILQTGGSLMLSVITAYAFVRFRFPLKNAIFIAFLSLMMIPGTLTLTSSYVIVGKLRLINSIWGVILPGFAGGIPMSLFLLRSFFSGVSKELFEAAEIDGANDYKMLINIMVPLSLPIISTLGISAFMGSWNDYLWPSLVLLRSNMKTISVALVSFTDQYFNMTGAYSVAFAGYIIASIPLIVLFSLTSKQFIQGISSGAFKM